MAKNNFRKWFTVGFILFVANTSSVVFAQEDQDNDPAAVDISVPSESSTSTPSVGSGPWGGSTNTRPTRDNSSSAGALARPGNGNTVLDPGDGPPNPDVPFDSNMNIAFLVVGLIFAFVVYKKKFTLNKEPLTK